jgi:hypothetical protein
MESRDRRINGNGLAGGFVGDLECANVMHNHIELSCEYALNKEYIRVPLLEQVIE